MKSSIWLFLICSCWCSHISGQATPLDSVSWYNKQGQIANESGNYVHMANMYQRAFQLYQQHNVWDSAIISLGNASFAYRALKDTQRMHQCLKRVRFLADSLFQADHLVWSKVYEVEGFFALQAGEYDKALFSFEQSLKIRLAHYKDVPHKDVVQAYGKLGSYYMVTEDPKKCLENYMKAIPLLEKVEIDSFSMALLLRRTGLAHINNNKFEEAKPYFHRALNISKQRVGQTPTLLLAILHNDIGVNYMRDSDYIKGGEYLRKSLDIKRQLPDANLDKISESYINLANLYGSMNEVSLAILHAKRALEIRIELWGENSPNVIHNHLQLGILFHQKEQFEEMIHHLEQGLALYESHEYIGKKAEPISYALLAEGYQALGQHDKVEASFQAAFREIERADPLNIGIGSAYTQIARVKMKYENYEEAEELISQSLEVMLTQYGKHAFAIGFNYLLLGELYLYEKKHAKSIEMINESLKGYYQDSTIVHTKIGTKNLILGKEFKILSCLQLITMNLFEQFKASDEPQFLYEAWKSQENVLHIIDSVQLRRKGEDSQLFFQSFFNDFYGTAQEILFSLHQHTDSLHYLHMGFKVSERNKASTLRQAFIKSRAGKDLGIPMNVQEQTQAFIDSLNSFQKQLSRYPENSPKWFALRKKQYQTALQQSELLQQIKLNFPNYYQLVYQFDPPSVEELQAKVLSPQQALISYGLGKEFLSIFVITPDSFAAIQHPITEAFSENLSKLRMGITQGISGHGPDTTTDYQGAAGYLYQQLIAPIQPTLHNIDQLIIVPANNLGFLPFDVLLTSLDSVTGKEDYLIHQYMISYVFSAALLAEIKNVEPNNQPDIELLVMTPSFNDFTAGKKSISYRRDSYFPLPFSKKEGTHISLSYQGTLLSDSLASKEQFKLLAPRSRIIHLATHAKAFNKDSRNSHIAFSSSTNVYENDHHLNVAEIYALNLPADMVVLSACETGLGELKEGEGIISLGRAFTYAGAKSIISTLWSVNDQSTSKLMISFYDYLDQGMHKDAALRQAKIDYLNTHDAQFSHPYFWAAPIAIGDMSPVKLPSQGQLWWLWGLILGLVATLIFIWKKRNSS
ncbi:MAG: CHAT domain-containing tetratricopeptide repeat protein [Bacteroidota bacterium]